MAQGSPLGVIIFNDIIFSILGDGRMYADDTSGIVSGKEIIVCYLLNVILSFSF